MLTTQSSSQTSSLEASSSSSSTNIMITLISNSLAFIILHFSLPVHVACLRRLNCKLFWNLFQQRHQFNHPRRFRGDDSDDDKAMFENIINDQDNNDVNDDDDDVPSYLSLVECRFCLLRAAYLVITATNRKALLQQQLRQQRKQQQQTEANRSCSTKRREYDEDALLVEQEDDEDEGSSGSSKGEETNNLNPAPFVCHGLFTNLVTASNVRTDEQHYHLQVDMREISYSDVLQKLFENESDENDDTSWIVSIKRKFSCDDDDDDVAGKDFLPMLMNQLDGIWCSFRETEPHQQKQKTGGGGGGAPSSSSSAFGTMLSSSPAFAASLLSCAWKLDLGVILKEVFLIPCCCLSQSSHDDDDEVEKSKMKHSSNKGHHCDERNADDFEKMISLAEEAVAEVLDCFIKEQIGIDDNLLLFNNCDDDEKSSSTSSSSSQDQIKDKIDVEDDEDSNIFLKPLPPRFNNVSRNIVDKNELERAVTTKRNRQQIFDRKKFENAIVMSMGKNKHKSIDCNEDSRDYCYSRDLYHTTDLRVESSSALNEKDGKVNEMVGDGDSDDKQDEDSCYFRRASRVLVDVVRLPRRRARKW